MAARQDRDRAARLAGDRQDLVDPVPICLGDREVSLQPDVPDAERRDHDRGGSRKRPGRPSKDEPLATAGGLTFDPGSSRRFGLCSHSLGPASGTGFEIAGRGGHDPVPQVPRRVDLPDRLREQRDE